MIKIPVIVSLLVISALSVAAQNYSVVPGKSVGAISLGLTRDAVWLELGKPSQVKRWPGGMLRDSWEAPAKPNSEEPPIFLNVIFRGRRVVQIEFNDPKYKTAEGIAVDSTLAQFREAYKRPLVRAYVYDDGEGSGYVGYYYDAQKRGIAFTFGTQDQFDARTVPEALRVHAAATSVIPEPRGKPTRAKDEVPVPKNATSQEFFQHANQNAAIINVITQFWAGLGELDADKLKQQMAWPITIVEPSRTGRVRSTVMNNPADFDLEFDKTPKTAIEKHRSEFYGIKPTGFVVQMISQSLASVSYTYVLPRDLVQRDLKLKGRIFKAVTILRRDERPGSPWRIMFTTVPA